MSLRRRAQPSLTEVTETCAVGTVTARSARFWMRVPNAGRLTLELTDEGGQTTRLSFSSPAGPESDHTGAVTYPDDFAGAPPLRPLTRYRFKIEGKAGRPVGQGGFSTFPASAADTPEKFCFAFSSCHQPFAHDGRPASKSVAMVAAARRALDAHDVKFLILGGDQVYADAPPPFSLHGRKPKQSPLLERSREEIRAVYHAQYRRSWAVPGFLELGLGRATHCMLDDHEIIDNWGSDEAHASLGWQRVAAGALDAYFDYQGARNLPAAGGRPPQLHHAFSYGTTAIFVADVRSERRMGEGKSQVMGEAQLAALTKFLRDSSDKHCVFIHIGVPLIHIPTRFSTVGKHLLARGSDLADRWSNPVFLPQRDRLLNLIGTHQQRHPDQVVALLSGDIHAGWAAALQPREGPGFYQFVASALTNNTSSMAGTFARTLLALTRPLETEVAGLCVRRVAGQPGNRNPYGGLNLGIVEIERADATSTVRFKLIGQNPKQLDQPLVVFDSGRLGRGSQAERALDPKAGVAVSEKASAGG